MSRRRAPTALRRPISRVRSVTDTSMMFITPMPPTTSEMPAIAPRKTVKVVVTLVAVDSMSVCDCTVKSSLSPTPILCKVRSLAVIAAMAVSMLSELIAETSIVETDF